jgi:hypothetical protein
MTKEDTSIEIDWERNFPAKGTGQLVIKDWRFSQQIPPSTIEFKSSHENTWVMRITPDRRIEVNEDVDVTYAAQKVLDAVQQLLTPQRQWVGLDNDDLVWIYSNSDTIGQAIGNTEAKLRSKNNG